MLQFCHSLVAAKLRGLPKKLQEELFSENHYKKQVVNNGLGWIGEFEYKKQRLLVSYKTDRARKDAHQRNQVLDKLRKRLGEAGNTQLSENSITKIVHEKIAYDTT